MNTARRYQRQPAPTTNDFGDEEEAIPELFKIEIADAFGLGFTFMAGAFVFMLIVSVIGGIAYVLATR